jgi:hypothetical protein
LAGNEGVQKPIGKDSSVIQPNLEIVARSLDHHRRLETLLTHFFEGLGAEIVYQAERMGPLPPDEDVRATSDCFSRFNWEGLVRDSLKTR